MIFKTKLISAILVKRYKRFLADVVLEDGQEITVYCPNTGSMRTCSTPGSEVMLSHVDKVGRKYPHTLEMIKGDEGWVGVNTSLTNALVAEAIERGQVGELSGIDEIRSEVKVSAKTRLDLLLSRGNEKIYVEVKNCSMVEDGVAMFPDAVTVRGTKHLRELAELVRSGNRGIIFFLVQRLDATHFSPAAHIDPTYASVLAEVAAEGVEMMAYQARVCPESIEVVGALPVRL